MTQQYDCYEKFNRSWCTFRRVMSCHIVPCHCVESGIHVVRQTFFRHTVSTLHRHCQLFEKDHWRIVPLVYSLNNKKTVRKLDILKYFKFTYVYYIKTVGKSKQRKFILFIYLFIYLLIIQPASIHRYSSTYCTQWCNHVAAGPACICVGPGKKGPRSAHFLAK